MITNIPKEFRNHQHAFYKWLYKQGYANWDKIHYICLQYIEGLEKHEKEYYGNHPEYKLFLPLLRLGIIECCEIEGKKEINYCVNLKIKFESGLNIIFYDIEKSFAPLIFLQHYPSIKCFIEKFNKEDISVFNYIMNIDTYEYLPHKNNNIGIYKTENIAWYTPYLIDENENIYKIPLRDSNPDGLNIARLYIRLFNKEKLFIYDKNKKILQITKYNEIPILLFRALLMFAPEQFSDTDFYYPYPINGKKLSNIPYEAIIELKRIFNTESVEVK